MSGFSIHAEDSLLKPEVGFPECYPRWYPAVKCPPGVFQGFANALLRLAAMQVRLRTTVTHGSSWSIATPDLRIDCQGMHSGGSLGDGDAAMRRTNSRSPTSRR